jgi:hypothetical protein
MALDVNVARIEAVFASALQASDKPTGQQIHLTITNMARAYGSRWCTARVAQEFGDHPDTAARRMAWARYMVAVTFPPRHRHAKRYPWCRRCWYTPERVAEIREQVRQAKAAARDEPPAPALTVAEVLAAIGVRS